MKNLVARYPVAAFVALTLSLSFAAYLLPIPLEMMAVIYPMIIVFIPTVVAMLAPAILHGAFNSVGLLITLSLTLEQATYLGGAVLVMAALVLVAARPSYWLGTEPQLAEGGRAVPEVS